MHGPAALGPALQRAPRDAEFKRRLPAAEAEAPQGASEFCGTHEPYGISVLQEAQVLRWWRQQRDTRLAARAPGHYYRGMIPRILRAAATAAALACADVTAPPPAPPLMPSRSSAPTLTLAVTCPRWALWLVLLDGQQAYLGSTWGDVTLRVSAPGAGAYWLDWYELGSTGWPIGHGQVRVLVGRSGPTIAIACQ